MFEWIELAVSGYYDVQVGGKVAMFLVKVFIFNYYIKIIKKCIAVPGYHDVHVGRGLHGAPVRPCPPAKGGRGRYPLRQLGCGA